MQNLSTALFGGKVLPLWPTAPPNRTTPQFWAPLTVVDDGGLQEIGLANNKTLLTYQFGNHLRMAESYICGGAALSADSLCVPHFGAGLFREALMLADACLDVCFATSSSNRSMLEEGLDLRSAFRRAIEAVGIDRLLFGTDSRFFPARLARNDLRAAISGIVRTGAWVGRGAPDFELESVAHGAASPHIFIDHLCRIVVRVVIRDDQPKSMGWFCCRMPSNVPISMFERL